MVYCNIKWSYVHWKDASYYQKKKKNSCKTFEGSLSLGEGCTEQLWSFSVSWWMWLGCCFPAGWLQRWLSLSSGCHRYSLSAWQKPDLQKFLIVFGFQWLFQQILVNLDWAATQLKPGNVIFARWERQELDQDLSSPWKMLTVGDIKEQTQRTQRTFFPSSFLDKTTQSCSWLCWNHWQPWAEMQWAAPTYRWSCAF